MKNSNLNFSCVHVLIFLNPENNTKKTLFFEGFNLWNCPIFHGTFSAIERPWKLCQFLKGKTLENVKFEKMHNAVKAI